MYGGGVEGAMFIHIQLFSNDILGLVVVYKYSPLIPSSRY